MHTQTQLKMNKDKILTLKNVTKSSIWELQENDVFRLWEAVVTLPRADGIAR